MAMNYSYLINETAPGSFLAQRSCCGFGGEHHHCALCSYSIRLPFTPVPIATQLHVILLLSCFLGSKSDINGCLDLYLPRRNRSSSICRGKAGILVLAGPTGGYLLGYVVAAFVTGFLMERATNRRSSKAFAAMGLGNLIVYLFGLPWLSRYVGWQGAFLLGMVPFLIGDMLKLVVATRSLKGLRFFNA